VRLRAPRLHQPPSSVESTEGISEIRVREPFRRWGVLRFRVRVRFTSGSEFTPSSSEPLRWSYSGFDVPCAHTGFGAAAARELFARRAYDAAARVNPLGGS